MTDAAPSVAFTGISKSFGALTALDRVDLSCDAGTIHAIVGENGAGKTTLMRILFGLIRPDQGSLAIDGVQVGFESPAQAIAAGIGMVSQHFELAAPLTVRENLLIGQAGSMAAAGRRVDLALQRLRTDYGLDLDGSSRIDRLSIGVRQQVEITKALVREARILIFDEPTALLGPHEAMALFAMLRGFKATGMTVILISHKLNEVRQVADRISVMRRGRIVLDGADPGTDETILAMAMIGRMPAPPALRSIRARGDTVLSTTQLFSGRLGPIDLDLHAGEIVGVAGVAGNGQGELLEALAGMSPAAGRISWKQQPLPMSGRARRLRRLGLAHIPEDRQRFGLLPQQPAWQNLLLGRSTSDRGSAWLDVAKLRREATAQMQEWDIRPADPDIPAGLLSGGNQQKLVCARELSHDPAAVLVAHPTRGVDLGTAEFLYRRLAALRDMGSAILLVSFDLNELLALADRILVLTAGRIVGDLTGREATPDRLGRLMAGLQAG